MSAFRCGWCGAEVSVYEMAWRLGPVPSCEDHAPEGEAIRDARIRLRADRARPSEEAVQESHAEAIDAAHHRMRGEVDTRGWTLWP